MPRSRLISHCTFITAFFAAAAIPAVVRAQGGPHPSADYVFKPWNVMLTISAGGAAFTDFQQDPARIVSGAGSPSADYLRRISAQTTATLDGALTVWTTNTVALQLEGNFTPTRFRITGELPGSSDDIVDPADTTRYARLDLFGLSINLLLRPPVQFGRVAPYAILGGGAVRYHVRDDLSLVPADARASFGKQQRTMALGVLGAGALIPLQRKRLLLTFDITDHMTRTPLHDRSPSMLIPENNTTVLVRPEGGAEGSDGISITSNVRLTVGLTIPLRLR